MNYLSTHFASGLEGRASLRVDVPRRGPESRRNCLVKTLSHGKLQTAVVVLLSCVPLLRQGVVAAKSAMLSSYVPRAKKLRGPRGVLVKSEAGQLCLKLAPSATAES